MKGSLKESLTDAIAYSDNIAYQPTSAETLLSGLGVRLGNCFFRLFHPKTWLGSSPAPLGSSKPLGHR